MYSEMELRDNEKEVDNEQVESSAQKPMPSIWYD